MAKFKIPKKIIFGVIEKTPTGKTQKSLLRKKNKSRIILLDDFSLINNKSFKQISSLSW